MTTQKCFVFNHLIRKQFLDVLRYGIATDVMDTLVEQINSALEVAEETYTPGVYYWNYGQEFQERETKHVFSLINDDDVIVEFSFRIESATFLKYVAGSFNIEVKDKNEEEDSDETDGSMADIVNRRKNEKKDDLGELLSHDKVSDLHRVMDTAHQVPYPVRKAIRAALESCNALRHRVYLNNENSTVSITEDDKLISTFYFVN